MYMMYLQRTAWYVKYLQSIYFAMGPHQGNLKVESVVAAGHLAVTYGGRLLYLWIFFAVKPANQFC